VAAHLESPAGCRSTAARVRDGRPPRRRAAGRGCGPAAPDLPCRHRHLVVAHRRCWPQVRSSFRRSGYWHPILLPAGHLGTRIFHEGKSIVDFLLVAPIHSWLGVDWDY